jgi:two-component sensor histidine kinase
MQGRFSGDEKLDDIFGECQDRILAMAAVHAMLYRSQNFAEINFGDYIRETAGQLFRSYKKSTAAISLVIHAENVMLSIDAAIPCGLIINELVTNALKYAFPEGVPGELRIEMEQNGNGARLLVRDNGVGFPQGMDFRNTETMGLKLVTMLVKQLDGTIEQVLDGGTGYLIMFKPQSSSHGVQYV